jgi:spermidine synthase
MFNLKFKNLNVNVLRANCFLLGFIGLIIQIIIFRETLIFANGNELTLGAIISAWLLGGAFGSYLSLKIKRKELFLKIVHPILALSLPLSLFTVRKVGPILIPPGESASFLTLLFLSFVSLFFTNLILDSEFLISLNLLSEKKRETPGFSYFLEAMGSFLGAILFTFFLSKNWLSWQIVFFLALLLLLLGLLIYSSLEKIFLLFLIGISVVSSFFAPSVEKTTRSYRFKNLIKSVDTPFQNATLTKKDKQINLFENGQIAASSGEHLSIQEKAHFPLASLEKVEEVLLIGGLEDGLAREVLKHPVKKVTALEIDSKVFELYTQNFPEEDREFLKDERFEIVFTDARSYLKNKKENYDVIILDTPDPRNAFLARLYTEEFMKTVKERLKPKGVFAFSFSSSEEYLSKEILDYNGTLFETARKVFPQVLFIPGEEAQILASKRVTGLSSSKIVSTLKERKVNSNLNPAYIDYKMERTKLTQRTFSQKFFLNTDEKPISIFLESLIWQAQFRSKFKEAQSFLLKNPYIFLLLLLFPFLFLLKRGGEKLLIMFSASIGGMIAELVIVFIYQLHRGYVYSHIGLLLAFFMLGLSLGSFTFRKKEKGLEILSSSLSLLLFALPFLTNLLSSFSFLFFYLSLIAFFGFLVGSIFPLIVERLGVEKSGLVYSFDLIGGALGSFLGGAMLLPLIGLKNSSFLAGALILLSILFLRIPER